MIQESVTTWTDASFRHETGIAAVAVATWEGGVLAERILEGVKSSTHAEIEGMKLAIEVAEVISAVGEGTIRILTDCKTTASFESKPGCYRIAWADRGHNSAHNAAKFALRQEEFRRMRMRQEARVKAIGS